MNEEAIDRLEECLRLLDCTGTREKCKEHIADTIALLKEQEAVEPRRDANSVRIFRCGACGEYVGFIDSDPEDPNEQDNYCRNCGRKVKWDDLGIL